MVRPEILAPGGSIESIYTAMQAGCNAVYMGGKRFGARAFADNPENEDLLKIIDNVHMYNKRLYLTVNTVLGQNEFKSLYEYIEPVYRQGLDAVIVQDMGVLEFIHHEFPDLAIHASTQMSIVNAHAVNMLIPYGVTRVIPARELSFNEIALLKHSTDAELEVFVHGALCCSYSGQCLMSSLIGGRSGNKGACAQPCRKQYSYAGGQAAYELSLKDLCTLEYLPEMVMSGVDSFKIEGRMKKPEYVAITTYMYKKYLDYYYDLGSERYKDFIKTSKEFSNDMMHMKDIYNRGGFTAGYLINDVVKSKMMTEKRPNHEGVIVGKIKENDKRKPGKVNLVFSEDVFAQDILEIRDDKGNTVHEHTLRDGIKKGGEIFINTGYNYNKIHSECKVYRVRNNMLISKIRDRFPEILPEISISGQFSAVIGKPSELKLWFNNFEDNQCSCSVMGNIVGKADKHAATEDDVRNKIMVSGETRYQWDILDVTISDGVFLSPAELKSMRRKAYEELKELYLSDFRRLYDKRRHVNVYEENNTDVCVSEIIAEVRNIEQFEASNTIDCIDTLYIHIEDMDMEDIQKLLELSQKQVFIVMPRLFRESNRIYFENNYDISALTYNPSLKGIVVCNLEEIAWFNSHQYDRLVMRTADNLYVRNIFAYEMYRNLGAEGCALSVEMTDHELNEMPECNADILIYGRLPAMIMANRFAKGGKLEDSYGNVYTVINHKLTDYCEILHYEAVDRINIFMKTRNRRLRMSFTIESGSEIQHIIKRLVVS